MNEQLYIDGELMDLAENTSITLQFNSNLFRDITKMVSNQSYTIKLPRTARNERVLLSVARVQHGGAWARTKHTARYYVDGVPLVDGLVTLLAVAEDFEISLTWGVYQRLADVVSSNATLRDLTSTASLTFWFKNYPENYYTAMARGYFYAFYNPFEVERTDEWLVFDAFCDVWNEKTTYTFASGAVTTGNVGDVLSLQVSSETGRYYAIADFWLGMSITTGRLSGTGDYAAWCVVDEMNTVIGVGNEALLWGYEAPTRAAKIILNTDDSTANAFTVRDITYNPTLSVRRASDIDFFDPVTYLLPSVSVPWLLKQIESDFGVRMQWSGDAQTLVNSLVVPCVERKTDESENVLEFKGSVEAIEVKVKDYLTIDVETAPSIFNEAAGASVTTLTVATSCTIEIDMQVWFSHTPTAAGGYYVWFPLSTQIEHTDTDGNTMRYYVGALSGNPVTYDEQYIDDGKVYHVIAGTGKIDVKHGDTIRFLFKKYTQLDARIITVYKGILRCRASLGDEVMRGRSFPIVRNLPDIKITDFIKTLCALTASAPTQMGGNGVLAFKGQTFDTSEAVDWSDKVTCVTMPEEMTYTLSEWARRNWWKWKEDEKTAGNYDGYMTVTGADEAEKETEFPFAASDGNCIPLWKRAQKYTSANVDTTSAGQSEFPTFQGCEPRIMIGKQSSDGYIHLTFDGLDMQTIIDDTYTGLQDILQDVVIIKVKVALSLVEISELDETRPVYIRQFASYFALVSLEVSAGELATAQLLRINV